MNVRGVVGVEQRPGNVARGVHAGVGQHGLERHFGTVALAFGIHGKPAHDERSQVQREGVGGELVNHRGSGALLDCGTCPAAHEDTVAGIAAFGGVGVSVCAVGDGGKYVDHLLVAADIARCQDDCLGAVILDILAVFRRCDNARDAAFGVANKLLGMGVEDEFSAVFDGGVVEHFAEGPVDGLAVAAYVVGLVAANKGHGVGIDAPLAIKLIPAVVFGGAGKCMGHADANGLAELFEVVENFAGAACPDGDELIVGLLARVRMKLAGGNVPVDVEALALVEVASDVAHVNAADGNARRALDDGDFGAAACGGFGGRDAREARADDDDVIALRFCDVGNGLGLYFPRVLGFSARRRIDVAVRAGIG